ncbi:putative c6 transcription protein [Rosellinia necatrix]|uniref:Putative c6 transcription protein n=1 Tax=Rosellinia necatrix TaxID=77044 RepID=A0A1S7UJF2_ROSNE|nr:putative c6 transcription protein [Rosellinia necatrix]
MASFISAAIRLVLRRRPGEGHMSDEHAQHLAVRPQAQGEPAVVVPAAMMPAVPAPVANPYIPGPGPGPAADHQHRPVYLQPEEDPLTFFRLMLGIQTTPYLGFTLSSPLGTRPAANIGLYARVIHSEQKAKDSFKVFSVVINGCYFLQIVIAAALTALGAARASSGAVTAFGALNTVIAGFLTFLKGSGLPGRLKYYGNEWKKIREYIEQRERDFMRTGHNLDVYEVIETIEKMYNNLKADIELNTPDSYTSLTNQRRAGGIDDKDSKIAGLDMSKLESLASKLKGLDGGKLESLAKGMNQHEKRIGDEVEHAKQDVQAHATRLENEARDREAQARAAIHEGKQTARDAIDGHATRLGRAIDEHKTTVRDAADSQVARLSRAVGEHMTATRDAADGHVARLDHAVGEHGRRLDAAASEQHARALETVSATGRAAQDGIAGVAAHATGSITDLVREIGDIHRTAVSDGRGAAAQQIRNLAQRLAGHDHRHDEQHPPPPPQQPKPEK